MPLGENIDIPGRRQARDQNANIHPERIELHHPSENEPCEHWVNSEFCDGNQARGNGGSAVETLQSEGPAQREECRPAGRTAAQTEETRNCLRQWATRAPQ